MKRFLLFILIISVSISGYCQSTHPPSEAEDALFKYWDFQKKMEDYFMIAPGDAFVAGSGIPASIVNICNNFTNSQSQIKFGDAPIDLAFYLASLALQYRLLDNVGENTLEVRRKIFEELSTINRLDATAEWFQWPGSYTPNLLEGYFIKDDVVPAPGTCGTTSQLTASNSFVYKKYQSEGRLVKECSNPSGAHPSQDQIIHLLTALKCITEFIPSGVNYNNTHFDYEVYPPYLFTTPDFNLEAKRIANRLVYYMRNRDKWIHHHSPKHWMWSLRDNTTGNLVNVSGHYPFLLATGHNRAQESILGAGTVGVGFDPWCWVKKRFTNGVWKLLKWIPTGVDNDLLPLTLATVGNSWWSGLVQPMAVNLYWRSALYGFEHIPLLYSIEHSAAPLWWPESHYWDLIVKDPMYEGAYCLNTSSSTAFWGNYEWSSTSRLVHPERRGDHTPDFPGSYNNLDYMFLYNMVHLNYWSTMPPYLNGFDPYISYLVNFPYHNYGTFSDPYVVKGRNTITAINDVQNNAAVTYRAGESIELKPGFDAVPGSNFLAFINPFITPIDPFHRCVLPRLASDENFGLENTNESKNENNTGDFELGPNPFHENLNIKINVENNNKIKLELFDQIGRLIKIIDDEEDLNYNYYYKAINLEELPSGSYLLKVKLDNKYMLNKKIFKM